MRNVAIKALTTLCFALLTLGFIVSPSAHAYIEQVSVESEGIGPTKKDAIMDAVVQAISQVNGAEIAAQTMSTVREHSLANSQGDAYALTESFQKDIKTTTNGLVDGWQVLSVRQAPELGGVYVASIRTLISKYHSSNQLKRLRMAVAGFTVSDQVDSSRGMTVMKAFTRGLQDYLTQTRKFAMLEREMMAEQNSELERISTGGFPTSELARLGNRVGTDYIIVGEVEKASLEETMREMQTTGKTFTLTKTSGRVSFRIIDVATTQVKFSDSVGVTLKGNSLGDVGRRLVEIAGEKILNAIFPIRVLGVSGNSLILGQGGETLRANTEYMLIKLGKRLIDPYTQESLGYEEVEVGKVKITKVQSKSSVAEVVNSKIDLTDVQNLVLIVRPLEANQGRSVDMKKKVNEINGSGNEAIDALEKESNDDW